jgi:hypothetical protein
MSSRDPPVTLKKSEFLLYEPRDTPVALTNLMHLSCPICGVREIVISFHKD